MFSKSEASHQYRYQEEHVPVVSVLICWSV